MTQRLDLAEVIPDGYRAVAALERYTRTRNDHILLELVKLRASILNGCSFCVDMHTTDLLASGEDARRVAAVAVWHESGFFTPRERATLALTDAVTRLEPGGVPDAVWNAAVDELGEGPAADLVLAIATINVWNRLAVTARTRTPVLAR